jgi:hypothetical protein
MDAKSHRLIFSLLLDITPGPDSKPGEICQLVVPLKRDGNSAGRSGVPRPPCTSRLNSWYVVFLVHKAHILTAESYSPQLLLRSNALIWNSITVDSYRLLL